MKWAEAEQKQQQKWAYKRIRRSHRFVCQRIWIAKKNYSFAFLHLLCGFWQEPFLCANWMRNQEWTTPPATLTNRRRQQSVSYAKAQHNTASKMHNTEHDVVDLSFLALAFTNKFTWSARVFFFCKFTLRFAYTAIYGRISCTHKIFVLHTSSCIWSGRSLAYCVALQSHSKWIDKFVHTHNTSTTAAKKPKKTNKIGAISKYKL